MPAPASDPAAEPAITELLSRAPAHDDPRIDGLVRHAVDTSGDPVTDWPPGSPLAGARNAHSTNSIDSLHAALDSDANWLEGDVALVDGELRMAHPGSDPAESLAFDDWIGVVARSGRGVKLDLKSSSHERLASILAAVRESGIDPGKVMVNVGELPDAELVAIRRALPQAWISLNPLAPSGSYTPEAIDAVLARARLVGGPVSFALRWDAADQATVDRLAPSGSVSVWSNPWYGTPDDVTAETEALRARGVDGMVDITEGASRVQHAVRSARAGLQHLFGADPYALGDSLRRSIGDLFG